MSEPSAAPALEQASVEQTSQAQQHAATEVFNNVKVSLADLCAKGTSHYARKNYSEAVDCYARASELQAELNGEMSADNAEILFLYGRSLFRVGQQNSDLLGGKATNQAGEEKKRSNESKKKEESEPVEESLDAVTEAISAQVVEKNGESVKKEDGDAPKKPLFQFEGDENFEDSDNEEQEDDDEDGEEEDDFAVAFEVLEVARIGFEKQLDEPETSGSKGKATGDSEMTTHIKERLSETHDLLAEISLENERFPNAVEDFRASLKLKEALYPFESEIVAEAWFKLSLALEFSSITEPAGDDADEVAVAKETEVDEELREESAKALEKAIESTKLKLHNWEVDLASTLSVDDNDVTIRKIADVKELIADMELRLQDVRAKPVDIKGLTELTGNGSSLAGILGETLGETPEQIKTRLEEAQKTATDLTSLVRKKEKKPVASSNVNGKRSAEDEPEVDTKKAKVEEAAIVDEE